MNHKALKKIYNYVNQNIDKFHKSRIEKIRKMKLHGVLLRKNPYLFKAKNITKAHNLVETILDAYLSSSEEGLFGQFMEGLAIFVSQHLAGGRKSPASGLDLEFEKDDVRYLVAIKSGANWGNSSQYKALKADFRNALRVLRQTNPKANIQPILGICYGKFKTKETGDYRKIAGQNFWYFISGHRDLYTEIIEPIGYEAKKHNDDFHREKDRIINKFTREFIEQFCDSAGNIDWKKLVTFNSCNYKQEPEKPAKPRKTTKRF